ncbi:hypothetical protein FRC20_010323, partial [Serendipita sp. 405]
MIIIPPDKTQDHYTTTTLNDQDVPHESQSLPGPPPAIPKRPNQRNRKRRIRIAACAVVLISLVVVFHSVKYVVNPEMIRHKTKKLFHRPHKPLFNPYTLQTIEKKFL